MPERIEDVLRDFQQRSALHEIPTLEGLVKQWADFVREVEQGYKISIYDYTNDLSVRDLLTELENRVGQETRERSFSLMRLWDERFRFATTEMQTPLQGSPVIRGWWWYRVPRLLRGELKQDLEGAT